MAIVAPPVSTFKARYSAFLNVNDERVSVFLEDATGAVNEGWALADIPRGIMAYAAHLLASEGEPDRSRSAAGETIYSGSVNAEKVGDVEVRYGSQGGKNIIFSGKANLELTPYGRTYLELARRNTVTLLVV